MTEKKVLLEIAIVNENEDNFTTATMWNCDDHVEVMAVLSSIANDIIYDDELRMMFGEVLEDIQIQIKNGKYS